MSTKHNPEDIPEPRSVIDRVAAGVARRLERRAPSMTDLRSGSGRPGRATSPDDMIANAQAWISALRQAIDGSSTDDEMCEPARNWITYLDVLCLNAAIGAPAGMSEPGVPVGFALGLAEAR